MRKISFIIAGFALPIAAVILCREHFVSGSSGAIASIASRAAQAPYFLVLAIALMPLNWGFETRKWQLLRGGTFFSAFREVMSGTSLAMVTPNRVGEVVGRLAGTPPGERKLAAARYLHGSLAQGLITLWMGLLALCFAAGPAGMSIPRPVAAAILICSLLAGLWVYFRGTDLLLRIRPLRNWFRWLEASSTDGRSKHGQVLLLSLARYLVFSAQFALLIFWLDDGIKGVQIAGGVALTYLLSALVPSSLLGELGIRESAAVLAMSYAASPLALISASLLLWVINLIIPAMAGSVSMLALAIGPPKRKPI